MIDEEAAGDLRYKDVESLVGKLSWIAEVMVAGLARVRRLSACLWMGKNPRRCYSNLHLSLEPRRICCGDTASS